MRGHDKDEAGREETTETTKPGAQQGDDGRLGGRLWMRFSAYEIGGGMIRPAPGAELDLYDPCEVDDQAVLEEERPYKQLLRLAQLVDLEHSRLEIAGRPKKLLEAWLTRNGLLGILPHETLVFETAPYWRELMTTGAPPDNPLMAPYQRRASRAAGGWRYTLSQVGPERPLQRKLLGSLAPPEALRRGARTTETIYRRWPEGELHREPLGTHWRNYFESASFEEARTRDYPSFSEPEFWQHYGEPIPAFIWRARRLAEAIAAAELRHSEEQWRKDNAQRAISELNDAAFGTSLAANIDENGALSLDWASPSLFGCYALLILQDLAGGQRAMQCPVCGGIFLSSAHQARFCSSTCRYTHHKRQQRRTKGSAADLERPDEMTP